MGKICKKEETKLSKAVQTALLFLIFLNTKLVLVLLS